MRDLDRMVQFVNRMLPVILTHTLTGVTVLALSPTLGAVEKNQETAYDSDCTTPFLLTPIEMQLNCHHTYETYENTGLRWPLQKTGWKSEKSG
jgi:hypothetical protein